MSAPDRPGSPRPGDTSSVPVELSAFVGRVREIAEIRGLLSGSRLITLTGAGGSGKSRLALEVVAGLEGDVFGPVGWASLAALEDPAHVLRQVAGAFGIPEEVRGGLAGLINLLGETPRVLVLDNCEHLVEPAARLAAALLAGCPGLRILATSREALGIGGERAWLVPPLSLPAPNAPTGELGASEAVQLFLERGRDAVAGYSVPPDRLPLVAGICRTLDGIPLALELAAARVRVLSLEQISDRLDDALRLLTQGARTGPSRHRTLQATIDWSHDLLPPEARVLFRRLAAFRGGFTLEGVESVGGGEDVDPDQALDLLTTLVDKSLVLVQEEQGLARYDLLETVRQYARRRLQESDEEQRVRRLHARFFVDRVAAEEPRFTEAGRREAIARLLPDLENIREALHWSVEHDPPMHVRLVGMLWWFWYSTALWTEARGWIEGALAHPGVPDTDPARGAVLFAHGALSALQARPDEAREALGRAAGFARARGDDRLLAYVSNYLGLTWASEGRAEGAEPLRLAEAWFREHGDLYGLRLTLLLQGSTAAGSGDLEAAERLNREGVAIARVFGIERELAVALQNLAAVHLRRRDADQAEPLLLEALACSRRDPSYFFMAVGLDYTAEALALQGKHRVAARVLGAADRLRSLIAAAPFRGDQMRRDAMILALQEAMGEETFRAVREGGASVAPETMIDELLGSGPERPGGSPPVGVPQVAPTGGPEGPDAARESSAGAVRDHASRATQPSLVVRTMGPVEIEVDGRRLDGEAWPYARPRELLLLLVARPAGATREQIGEALWPDSTPARIKNSFHVTLHHLRRTLDRPDWIELAGGFYRLLPDLHVRTDVRRLDHLLRESRAVAARLGPPSEVRTHLEAAWSLCRGEFLEGEVGGPWIHEERDRVRRMQVSVAMDLGHLMESLGEAGGAVDLYQWVAAREQLSEEVHRRLMEALVQAGDRPRAIRHYHRVVELLRDQVDADPEEATTRLYDRIRCGP